MFWVVLVGYYSHPKQFFEKQLQAFVSIELQNFNLLDAKGFY